MRELINLEYFYGIEAEQFAFYNPLVYNNLASEKDSIYRGIAKW